MVEEEPYLRGFFIVLGPESEDIQQEHLVSSGRSLAPTKVWRVGDAASSPHLLLERDPRLAAWTSTCIAHLIACASSFLQGEIIPVEYK